MSRVAEKVLWPLALLPFAAFLSLLPHLTSTSRAEPLARRRSDSNGDPCPDAGDRVANIIIIVVVITATTSPIRS